MTKHRKKNRRTAVVIQNTYPERKRQFQKFAKENGYDSLTHLYEEAVLALMLRKSVQTGVSYPIMGEVKA
jgi:hypothetical protein